MTQESSELAERIMALPADDLLRIVESEASDYRPEALAIARREIQRRGLAVTPAAEEPAAWTCAECGTSVQAEYRVCWNCGASDEGVEDPSFQPQARPGADPSGVGEERPRSVREHGAAFQVYRGGLLTSWESLFAEAADFASQLPADRLISISHSGEANDGVVTVWYREDGGEKGRSGDE